MSTASPLCAHRDVADPGPLGLAEARIGALGAWLAVPDRIAEWAGFAPSQPGTLRALARLRSRLIGLGRMLAHVEVLEPGALEDMAREEVDACALDDGLLDEVWADVGGHSDTDDDLGRHLALCSLQRGAAVGLCIAAGLMDLPVRRRD